jgi:hypothetical protein
VRVLPRLASDGSGGAVIVWVDYRAGNGDIYAARVLADGVVGTLIDLVSAEAEQGAVRLEWSVSAELTGPLWVERRTIESDFIRIATLLPGGSRRVTYLDRDVTPGGRYGYRLSAHDGDGGVQTDPVWVTVPGPPALVLERIRPNPAADVFTVGFELPGSGAARLEVVDAAGRVCVRREVGSLGPGRHEVMVGSRHALAAGIYLVRLTRGGEVRTERLSIIR